MIEKLNYPEDSRFNKILDKVNELVDHANFTSGYIAAGKNIQEQLQGQRPGYPYHVPGYPYDGYPHVFSSTPTVPR